MNLDGVTKEGLIRGRARVRHLHFMKYCWQRRMPFLIGKHTREISDAIDRAFKSYRKGISSFIAVRVSYRHGKSDLVSRYLPAHFLGEFPEDEIIVTGYSAGLVRKFSRFARGLIRSKKFQELYPNHRLSDEVANVDEWELDNAMGRSQWLGLGGSMVGSGGNLLICDDFFKNRQEAESETIRESRWESFTNDFITRAAPVFICIVLATPWHIDDIFGRIFREMDANPNFPRFEDIKFPAWEEDSEGKRTYLFPERFSPGWYKAQEAFLGEYATASLLLCDPKARGGNLLKTERVKYVDNVEEFKAMAFIGSKPVVFKRAWDLASSVKETQKSDPDWTIGVRGAVVFFPTAAKNIYISVVYIDDVIRMQKEAPARDKIIQSTAIADGSIQVGIEAFGAYKDAYTTIKKVLLGIRVVKKMQLPGDKMAKASPLESIFEAGNVYLKRAPWNKPFLDTLKDFPSGTHDDDVDGLSVLYHMFTRTGTMVYGPKEMREDKEMEGKRA